jgi:phosphate starvation-inducible PhoH-like protein
MGSVTLEFENARDLRASFADDERLLREVEQAFGLKITTRDGWLRIEGEEAVLSSAGLVFQQVSDARSRGFVVGRQEFRHALKHALGETRADLGELLRAGILCNPGRAPVLPRSEGQIGYIHAIRAHDLTFGLGPAGTGKTYLAVALAVHALKQERISRIVLTRPAVEAGEALGFLPGDLQEKILPYLRPLYDALHDMLPAEEIQRYVERGVVEIAPLAYMRGRTLNHAFVILDEAQNTTTEQMFMFLTRLGADSQCVITGDRTQIDLPKSKRSGLEEALAALAGVPGIAFHQFSQSDVVRHPLVQAIIHAYRNHRENESNPGKSPA